MKLKLFKSIRRFFDPIKEKEVISALELHTWKTTQEVLKIINERRSIDNRITFQEIAQIKVLGMLWRLKIKDIAERKKETDLTDSERYFVKEPTIQDIKRQQERITSRDGLERPVWRLKESGVRVEDSSEIAIKAPVLTGDVQLI